jgi:hypothetical protein
MSRYRSFWAQVFLVASYIQTMKEENFENKTFGSVKFLFCLLELSQLNCLVIYERAPLMENWQGIPEFLYSVFLYTGLENREYGRGNPLR